MPACGIAEKIANLLVQPDFTRCLLSHRAACRIFLDRSLINNKLIESSRVTFRIRNQMNVRWKEQIDLWTLIKM